MEQQSATVQAADGSIAGANSGRPAAPSRKRSISGTGGLLSRIPFVRLSRSGDNLRPKSRNSNDEHETPPPNSATPFPPVPEFPSNNPSETNPSMVTSVPPLFSPSAIVAPSFSLVQQPQQQKTRRRKGSLRKVALLGRGVQRERREAKAEAATAAESKSRMEAKLVPASPPVLSKSTVLNEGDIDPFGLGISDVTPRPSMDGYASRTAARTSMPAAPAPTVAAADIFPDPRTAQRKPQGDGSDVSVTSPTISYSTTDDEDSLHIGASTSRHTPPSSTSSLLRPERTSLSSGSEAYFPSTIPNSHPRHLGLGTARGNAGSMSSIQRRRSTVQRAKSPLALTSLAGLATTPLPAPDTDWDYSETEWWGWVVLIVTWVVFVTGMGSTLGIWSWAWDVGKTPYAPPELEDDPTLPIVGYYPALIILTCVMAWVWVVVAWMGMKYFRHARVSGD